MTKYCSRCHRCLPLTAFGRHRGRWDGRQGWCRECANLDQRRRYARRHGYGWVEREGRLLRPWPPAERAG
jgi:hypothetical protein